MDTIHYNNHALIHGYYNKIQLLWQHTFPRFLNLLLSSFGGWLEGCFLSLSPPPDQSPPILPPPSLIFFLRSMSRDSLEICLPPMGRLGWAANSLIFSASSCLASWCIWSIFFGLLFSLLGTQLAWWSHDQTSLQILIYTCLYFTHLFVRFIIL